MKWIYAYITVFVIHLAAILADISWLRFTTKPLLLTMLLAFFLKETSTGPSTRHFITAAIFFSWLGDVFLMNEGSAFFLAGLAAFLLAHLAYIFFFLRSRQLQLSKTAVNFIVIGFTATYCAAFYSQLYHHLDNGLKIPVFVYALTIGTMVITAWHAFPDRKMAPAISCIAGAILFIFSDSLLTFNTFIQPVQMADFVIMLSYGLAQFLIIRGSSQWLPMLQKSYF